MESIIKDEIIAHLHNNKLIKSSQHGFLPGRSCTTNLIDYMNTVTKTLDKGGSFDAILVDFEKAFDRVPFDGMLRKCEAHGVGGKLLQWLKMATGRPQWHHLRLDRCTIVRRPGLCPRASPFPHLHK